MQLLDSSCGPAALAGALAVIVLMHPPLAVGQTGLTLGDALREALRLNPSIANLSAAEAEVSAAQYDLVFSNAQARWV